MNEPKKILTEHKSSKLKFMYLNPESITTDNLTAGAIN